MDEQDLLRLNIEPCTHFDENQIHQALMHNIDAFMEELEDFYFAWQKNEAVVQMPRKQIFETKDFIGDFRVMPCVIDGFKGKLIKAVKIIGTNEEERVIKDKICVGKALLINATDNFVQGTFDVCALSSFRTAAISVLAFKHTVDIQNKKIGLVGTGRIGFYTAVILEQWLGFKELSIHDINERRMSVFSEILGKRINIKRVKFKALSRSCSAVFLSTTSSVALLNAKQAINIQFISSVGADADNLSELSSDLLKNRKVISESQQNVYFGDLNRWYKSGLLKKENIIELKNIIGCNLATKKPVMFISTGTAIQDALICQFLYQLLNSP